METIRGTLARRGGTHRPAIHLPEDATSAPSTGVVRLVLGGSEWHAPVAITNDDRPTIQGAYESASLARDRSGTDHLTAWVNENDLAFGRSVLVDVVIADYRYGVRAPGEDAIYDVSRPPSTDLQAIVESLEE